MEQPTERTRRARLPSPAMTVACIALGVALSGASYAAVALPRNSVGTPQLKRNAVTSVKVRNNSLTGADVNEARLGTVPAAVNATNATNATNAENAANAVNAANADRLDNHDSVDLFPVFVQATGGANMLDLDASPIVCQTPAHTPTSQRVARVDSWFSATPASSAPMSFFLRNVYSTNGGSSWTSLDALAVSRAGSDATGVWAHGNNSATVNVTPGTSYIFAVQVGRLAGATDPSDHRCEVLVELSPR